MPTHGQRSRPRKQVGPPRFRGAANTAKGNPRLKREVIVCDDDEQAKRVVAKQITFSHAIELWQEARMIATFEPRHNCLGSKPVS
jgi:hypothetical protein